MQGKDRGGVKNNRLVWNCLTVTNSLAYYDTELMRAVKSASLEIIENPFKPNFIESAMH